MTSTVIEGHFNVDFNLNLRSYGQRFVLVFFFKFGVNQTLVIPIKMEDFFNAEISIYSRGIFHLFVRRFSNETPCP